MNWDVRGHRFHWCWFETVCALGLVAVVIVAVLS